MKITYFKGKYQNFGDDLNPWMWPKILPGFFDDDESTAFLGIGSIIGERKFDKSVKKIVFGSAFVPEYHDKPDTTGNDWNIYFVRGPRTAKLLGLPPEKSVGDSAILLRTLIKQKHNQNGVISFMPHWESLEHGNWEEACRLAGITLIDPRRSVEEVIEALLNSKLIITEAMHGAIVADALRLPWIPLVPIKKWHRAKWYDWADALDIKLQNNRLLPSSIEDVGIWKLKRVVRYFGPFSKLSDKFFIHLAAFRLKQLARVTPQLSSDAAIEHATTSMLEKVEQLRKDYASVS